MSDEILSPEDDAVTAKEASPEKAATIPVEVIILTNEHEIRGIVYASRKAKEDRRISDLLNNPSRRFLAVTDAQLTARNQPSSVRHYSFLQIHIDNIILIHPSTQALVKQGTYSREEASRFEEFRLKVRQAAG
jgi:hypothetical protein